MKVIGNYWDDVFFAIIVFTVAVIIARVLRFIIGRLVKGASNKLKVDPTKYNFLKNAVEFIVYMIALTIVFNSIPKLKSYGTALFAGAGVLAAIVGFASQSAFSNIVSGIFIVIFRPFSVGDRVRVGQLYTGDVEDITLRHTVIKDFENRRIVIPNSVISNETIINSTLAHENLCVFIELGVSFDTDVDQAMRILQEEVMKHPDCMDNRTHEEIESGNPQVDVRLINITETALQLRAYAWAKDPSSGFNLKCDVLKSIKRRFDDAGISLAYPQRLIYIKESNTLKS
ncbi:mechanosensitive ion channel family protein [Ohtaekwangia koreensis]|nr:mechanosensitive ion channel family protein [Ohtaekwangia koreensis]